MAKSRPMGYVFPKRIKDAIAGESTPFGSKFYQTTKTKEEKEELEKELSKKLLENEERNKVFEESRSPWSCPTCKKMMRNKLDQKYYNRRGMCMDCTVKTETYLKTNGLYEEYEKALVLRNYKAYMIDVKEQAIDFINNLKDETKVVNHDGSFDTLKSDTKTVKEFILKEIEDIDKKLKEVEDIDMNISAEQALGINLKEIAMNIIKEEKEREQITEKGS